MVVSFVGLEFSYGATWWVEGNRVHIATEVDPDEPTYRDVTFVSDTVVSMTKSESGIEETWTRIR